MNTAPRGRLQELDVLRGLAALCVVLSHYTSYSARYLGGAPFGVLVPTSLALLLAALAAGGLIDGIWDAVVPAVEWPDVGRRLGVAAILFGVFALAVFGRLRFTIAPVPWFGGISYSLYLIHYNLGHSTLARLHDLGLPVWLGFLLALARALLLAAALTHVVERPAMRALRRWYRARPPAVAARS